MGLPQEIPWLQAPCRPDGEISRDFQEESKEGTCRCAKNPEGCCVDAIGIIIPKILKEGASLPDTGQIIIKKGYLLKIKK